VGAGQALGLDLQHRLGGDVDHQPAAGVVVGHLFCDLAARTLGQPRRILEPKSSFGRTGVPHTSQSTTASEEKGAPHEGQRRRSSPPHCGQVSGSSASNSSNHRRAAPQSAQNATQSPRTFRRSSRSQSAALLTR